MHARHGVLVWTLLAACSVPESPEPNVAVIAIGNDPGQLNPAITTAAHVHAVADSMFNGLVALDADLSPVPDLATDWEVLDYGRAYRFHLAEGVRWHDGMPFTSEDVRFTFEDVLLKFHARTRAGLASILSAIETPDPATVVFRFDEPYAPLLQRLDVTEAPILPAHLYAGHDIEGHPANLAPVGTGPFRFRAHRPDDIVELTRNDDYFKPSLPKLDRLVFRVIPEPSTRLLALESGEVDFVGTVRPSDASRIRRSENPFEVVATPSGPGGGNCVMTWIFNTDRAPFDELEFRKGLARAIDRQQIVERVLFGEASVASAPISSGIAWAHADGVADRHDYDPERAREFLSAFVPRRIDIVHFPSFVKYGEILRQHLARVGIELEVRALDRAAAVEAIYERREFDTALVSYCHGLDPDIGVRRMFDSASIGPVAFSNGAGYGNVEVDALFERAATLYERDARGELYRKAQELIARDLPYWWLVETRVLTVHASTLQDFAPWSGQFAERARRVVR